MDLTVGSPAMLKHYLVLAHDKKCYKEIEDDLRSRGKWKQKEAINREVVRTILRSRKGDMRIKGVVMGLLSGSTPTPAWMWAHGWKVEAKCPACQCDDDIKHILEGCGENRQENFVVKLLNALSFKEPPPLLYSKEDLGIRCFINGWPTNLEDFEFLPNVIIYTDGSCKNVRWKAVAVASAAAYQKGPDGKHRYAVVQVPRDQPQSAVAA
jgi:hypothetical protein